MRYGFRNLESLERRFLRVLREPRIERKEPSIIRLQFYPFVETVTFFFFLFLKDYNNWWLLMRYLSSFALSRGREPKSIPPFCSSTRQISRLTNSLYKYTFFIPPFLGGSIQFIITHWDCTRVQFQFPI